MSELECGKFSCSRIECSPNLGGGWANCKGKCYCIDFRPRSQDHQGSNLLFEQHSLVIVALQPILDTAELSAHELRTSDIVKLVTRTVAASAVPTLNRRLLHTDSKQISSCDN